MIKIMTPGPTQVRENIRIARSLETTNPDFDLDFFDFYKDTCSLAADLLETKNEVYILGGEGILGLEAACASLTEPGDPVLIIDNGIYGKGFSDFVKLYGGIPTYFTSDYDKEIDVEQLEQYLTTNHTFKYATVVHCDTPSGVLNDVTKICQHLHQHGILSVVDSVSAMFGEPLSVDTAKIDILCGGSQKVISAPPGLTLLAVSEKAMTAMKNRVSPITSYYANILTFNNYYEKKWFPYTMPISDIYGLRVALENIKDENQEIYERHKRIGEATRKSLLSSGLKLYLASGYSNTVSVIEVPNEISASDIIEKMKVKYHILIAGSFDFLADKVIRIGHMGENCNITDMELTLDALTKTLEELNFPLRCNIRDEFIKYLNL